MYTPIEFQPKQVALVHIPYVAFMQHVTNKNTS